MQAKSILISTVTVAAILLFATGCSPTQLGSSSFRGEGVDMLQDDSKLQVISKGDTIQVKIIITEANVCTGEFKLYRQDDAYPPFMTIADLMYSGKWAANQSPECQKQIGGPGGMAERRVKISEMKFPANIWGDDKFVVCSAGTDLFCVGKNAFEFEMVVE